jgi:hypothetical protein
VFGTGELKKAGYIPGLVGLSAWLSVTNTSHVIKGVKEAFTGVARAFEVLVPATFQSNYNINLIEKLKREKQYRDCSYL